MLVDPDLCTIQRPLDDQKQLRVRLEAEAILGFIGACEAGQAEMLSSDALQYEAGGIRIRFARLMHLAFWPKRYGPLAHLSQSRPALESLSRLG
jgi:hypothetical protein